MQKPRQVFQLELRGGKVRKRNRRVPVDQRRQNHNRDYQFLERKEHHNHDKAVHTSHRLLVFNKTKRSFDAVPKSVLFNPAQKGTRVQRRVFHIRNQLHPDQTASKPQQGTEFHQEEHDN